MWTFLFTFISGTLLLSVAAGIALRARQQHFLAVSEEAATTTGDGRRKRRERDARNIENEDISKEEPLARTAAGRRQIRQKQRLMERSAKQQQEAKPLKKRTTTPNSDLPAGQALAREWIVLDLGQPKASDFDYTFGSEWLLSALVYGSSAAAAGSGGDTQTKPDLLSRCEFTAEDVRELAAQSAGEGLEWERRTVDWHCVTGWTTKRVTFVGFPLRRLLDAVWERVGSAPTYECLLQTSSDGYTVPVFREDVEDEEAFFAFGIVDESDESVQIPIPREHGTARLLFPKLWGWKSVKFVDELHFLPAFTPGFWEKFGCHPRGRISHDERWSEEPGRGAVWKFLTAWNDLWRVFFGQRTWMAMMSLGAWIVASWARFAGFFSSQKGHRAKPV
jgi:Oxidoreductase molybdopterin binding domain